MTSNPTITKPTKIMAEPHKVLVNGVATWMILTDAGLFTAAALSRLLGLHNNGMTYRLSRIPWDDPHILGEPRRGRRFGKQAEHMEDFGNNAWRALGSTPRNARLQTLAPPCYAESGYPTSEEEWDRRAKEWVARHRQ